MGREEDPVLSAGRDTVRKMVCDARRRRASSMAGVGDAAWTLRGVVVMGGSEEEHGWASVLVD